MNYIIIGDVHGYFSMAMKLIEKSNGATPVFVGDLLDRGPECLEMMEYLIKEKPLSVMGNHDWKFARYLKGNGVTYGPSYGVEPTLEALEKVSDRDALYNYFKALPIRMTLTEEDKTVNIAHAAAYPDDFYREPTQKSKSRMLYGITTGRRDAEGYPERLECADKWCDTPEYFVHGHEIADRLVWRGLGSNVLDVDTGVCIGGPLSGLLFPSMRLLQVKNA